MFWSARKDFWKHGCVKVLWCLNMNEYEWICLEVSGLNPICPKINKENLPHIIMFKLPREFFSHFWLKHNMWDVCRESAPLLEWFFLLLEILSSFRSIATGVLRIRFLTSYFSKLFSNLFYLRVGISSRHSDIFRNRAMTVDALFHYLFAIKRINAICVLFKDTFAQSSILFIVSP